MYLHDSHNTQPNHMSSDYFHLKRLAITLCFAFPLLIVLYVSLAYSNEPDDFRPHDGLLKKKALISDGLLRFNDGSEMLFKELSPYRKPMGQMGISVMTDKYSMKDVEILNKYSEKDLLIKELISTSPWSWSGEAWWRLESGEWTEAPNKGIVEMVGSELSVEFQ